MVQAGLHFLDFDLVVQIADVERRTGLNNYLSLLNDFFDNLSGNLSLFLFFGLRI
jgi:hypothetical protein